MKTLKITLLLALFLMVSSQTDQVSTKSESENTVDTHETTKTYYDLLAHSRDKIMVPTRG